MDRNIFAQNAKWQYLAFIILILGLFIFSVSRSQAFTGKKQKRRIETTQKASQNGQKAPGKEELSAWKIIEMTDWLFWPFVLLTTTGVLLLTYKGLVEYREKSRAKLLLQQKIGSGDLRRVVGLVQTSQPNRAAKLMHQMIATFNKTHRAEPIGDDINTYLISERDSFETFNRVLGFLSDTAGALGLLGTVWGIFETFHAGKMDGPTILQGMSISLVTTLVGLIISLVLNMGATSIFAFFNGQLNTLASRSEELRQALLYLEAKSARGVAESPPMQRRPRTVQPNFPAAKSPEPRRHAERVLPTGQMVLEAEDNGYL